MVVDTSAIVAILNAEADRDIFIRALFRAPVLRLSPINWYEASVVAERGAKAARAVFEEMLADAKIEIVPVESAHMHLAFDAWRQYGKGRHRARLNLGDCFAYALAKSCGEPLLFKGDDFRHTDVVSAL
jgi:ribonuclease VapC